MKVRFTIDGAPFGKQRHRTGNGHEYTPEKTRRYMMKVENIIMDVMKENDMTMLEGPLYQEVKAYFPIPESWPKWKKELALAGRLMPEVRPDYDNIEKIISDSAQSLLFKDDKQICRNAAIKRYSAEPRVEVEIGEIEVSRCLTN